MRGYLILGEMITQKSPFHQVDSIADIIRYQYTTSELYGKDKKQDILDREYAKFFYNAETNISEYLINDNVRSIFNNVPRLFIDIFNDCIGEPNDRLTASQLLKKYFSEETYKTENDEKP